MLVGNNSFKVGLYIRLSRDDGNIESDSIISQRSLLNQYIKENNYNLIDEYVDDGFTGTNFESNLIRSNNSTGKYKLNLLIYIISFAWCMLPLQKRRVKSLTIESLSNILKNIDD